MLSRLALVCLALFAVPAFAVTIDGHIDPAEWQGAQHITDFRQTQPLTGKPATYPVEAWVLATPKGLAVAARVTQPPGVTRTRRARAAWPLASYSKSRFLSDFQRIEVPAYSQALLAVTPYVSALYDNVGHRGGFTEGADLFWKPNGQFQLTGTINPDFGEVESDDLVVNFGATETFFSDKRPFFTENHDGNGVGDIDAAVKFNGSVGTTSYGVLAADERGDAGRTFGAARVVHDFGDQSLGMMLTRVDHPFLDRTATVLGVDHHWHPTDRLTIGTNLVGSDIMQSGQRTQEVRKRITDLPPDSRYVSHDWHFRIDALDNDDRHLNLRRELRINRNSDLRDGSNEFAQINIDSAGYDDLLTRGHNALHLPPSINTHWDRTSPRHGNWAYKAQVEFYSNALTNDRRIGYDFKFLPTYFVSDTFSLYAGPYYEHTPDWLIWQHDNLIGEFDQHTLELDSGFDWYIGDRSELRLKLQAIGLDARIRGAYEVAANGAPIPSDEPVNDFRLRQLGVQLRYRYELAPLSYLYVVYGRGGFALDDVPGVVSGAPSQLGSAFSLRDDEQILVKLDYRFEM